VRLVLALAFLALLAPVSAQAAPPPLDGLYAGMCVRDDDQSSAGDASCSVVAPGLESVNSVTVSPDGRNLYATAQNTSVVSIFRREPNGTLSYTGCIKQTGSPQDCAQEVPAALGNTVEIEITRDGTNLYLASFNGDLTAWSRAPDGALALTACFTGPGGTNLPGCTIVSGLDQPESLALSSDEQDLYVAARDDTLHHFDRGAGGALTVAGCVEDNAPPDTPCTAAAPGLDLPQEVEVSPDGGSVYVGSSVDEAVVRLSRGAGGQLGFASCVEAAGGPNSGCTPLAGLGDPDGFAIPPDGRQLYVAAADQLAIFDRDASGTIAYAGCVKDPASAASCATTADGLRFPARVAAAGDTAIYAVADGVVALRRSPTGSLTPINCVRGADVMANCPEVPGLSNGAYSLGLSPDGQNAYATSFGAIAALKVERPPACFAGTHVVPAGVGSSFAVVCSDPGEDPLSLSLAAGPAHGVVALSPGVARYTPARGFTGPDAFHVAASDGTLSSAPATISISVVDAAGPDSNIRRIPRRVRSRRLRGFRGTASDDAGVRSVAVALVQLRGGARAAKRSCRVLGRGGTLRRRPANPRGRCTRRTFLPARGTARWRFRLRRPLPPGRYALYSRATDTAGKREHSFSGRDRNRVLFRVVR
jgi:DNA-binding beta-propeller fold protein YncE